MTEATKIWIAKDGDTNEVSLSSYMDANSALHKLMGDHAKMLESYRIWAQGHGVNAIKINEFQTQISEVWNDMFSDIIREHGDTIAAYEAQEE